MRPIIFDYNGTLFFDADINEWAWRQTVNEISKGTIDFDEVYKEFKSTRNYIFIEHIFKMLGYPLEEDRINYWAKRKETEYYHRFCKEHNRKELAPAFSRSSVMSIVFSNSCFDNSEIQIAAVFSGKMTGNQKKYLSSER